MKKIAVLDAETDPFDGAVIPEPFIWGVYNGDNYEQFYSTIDLMRYLDDKPWIVYAHNGGKFDYHFILDFLPPYSDIKIINGRIAEFKIGECTYRDSMNILPIALAEFQKTAVDYSIFKKGEREKPHNKKIIENYLYDDCYNLYQLVIEFINKFGLNLTQAGAAMKQWSRISGRTPPKDDGALYDYFKKYYYGGRCQTFEYGIIDTSFVMVDIRSAYPFAMLHSHPISLDFAQISSDDWRSLTGDQKGSSLLSFTARSNGALPFRSVDNSLFFPSDNTNRLYHCTGWELIAAEETGAVFDVEIQEAYTFYEIIDFKDYILHFYNERKAAKARGDKAMDIFAKLFMNSLYGKFGSNPAEYRNYKVLEQQCFNEQGQCESDDPARPWHYGGDLGAWALGSQLLSESEQRFYNVATAASITGFVRAYLWRALSQCERPLYCDTDSIAAVSVGNLPNGFGDELGQWSNEGEFVRAALAGRKLYAFEYKTPIISKKSGKVITHKIASKGVKLTPAELFRVASGDIVNYHPEAPTFSVHHSPRFQDRRVVLSRRILQENAI